MFSRTTYSYLSASCSSIPASNKASTKWIEEPSMMGGSDAFNSIKTLSISSPTSAAKTCSDVCMLTPFFSRFVPRVVFTTKLASAFMTGVPSKSTREKA